MVSREQAVTSTEFRKASSSIAPITPVAELKAKAERAKDVGVAKVASTRDRFSSTPSSKTNWDPNRKRVPPPSAGTSSSSPRPSTSGPPPPPSRSRPDVTAPGTGKLPPAIPRASRLVTEHHSPGHYTPLPPPTRVASGYPPGSSHRDSSPDVVAGSQIDWANLSSEDKEAFFGWLDEFFSRYLNIELSPGARQRSVAATASSLLSVSAALPVATARAPPAVNMATRPPV